MLISSGCEESEMTFGPIGGNRANAFIAYTYYCVHVAQSSEWMHDAESNQAEILAYVAYEHLVNCSDDWRPTANARRPSKLLNGVEISRDSTETGSFFFVVSFYLCFSTCQHKYGNIKEAEVARTCQNQRLTSTWHGPNVMSRRSIGNTFLKSLLWSVFNWHCWLGESRGRSCFCSL